MRQSLFMLLLVGIGSSFFTCAGNGGKETESATPKNAELHIVVEDYYEDFLLLNPVYATFNGDHSYNDRFTVGISPEHRQQSLEMERSYLAKLEAIDPSNLSSQDRLNWEIFRRGRMQEIEGSQYPDHLLPVSQFFSVPNFFAIMGSGQGVQPFVTVRDYDNWLSRIDGLAKWIDQAIVNMREGMAAGIVQPRVIMEKVLPQLAAHVVDEAQSSTFYAPIANMPDDFDPAERQRLQAAYEKAILETIVPAYARLHDFVRDEYLPRTRETFGMSDLPGGHEWYAYRVRTQTTSNMSPEEIHVLGLSEVERLTAEIEAREMQAAEKLGYESEEAMLDDYRSLKARVKKLTPKLFHEYPATDFEVRPVEPFRQASSAGASYMPGTPDGSRPGIFYVNTRNWQSRNRSSTEALYLHEAVPGHHFQISIQRELGELPRFRRFGGFTAYSEGWALYAETLGKELGVYEDPAQYVGALRSELFRAKRLVVDTGLHAKGWSREQAIDYMNGSVAEVERYIVVPGQALAYKVGQLKISELRRRAEERLGERFDRRDFHSVVLRDGAMPLDILEEKVSRWIETQGEMH